MHKGSKIESPYFFPKFRENAVLHHSVSVISLLGCFVHVDFFQFHKVTSSLIACCASINHLKFCKFQNCTDAVVMRENTATTSIFATIENWLKIIQMCVELEW